MKTQVKIGRKLKEFSENYAPHFLFLFFLLMVEGIMVGLSVLALAPFADYIVDSVLEEPSMVTLLAPHVFFTVGLEPSLGLFGCFFVVINLLKGSIEVTGFMLTREKCSKLCLVS